MVGQLFEVRSPLHSKKRLLVHQFLIALFGCVVCCVLCLACYFFVCLCACVCACVCWEERAGVGGGCAVYLQPAMHMRHFFWIHVFLQIRDQERKLLQNSKSQNITSVSFSRFGFITPRPLRNKKETRKMRNKQKRR